MNNLADSILSYMWFLDSCEEEICDPDYSLKLLENLSYEIENIYTNEERQALIDAAICRLAEPSSSRTRNERSFLQAISVGKFNGYEEEDAPSAR